MKTLSTTLAATSFFALSGLSAQGVVLQFGLEGTGGTGLLTTNEFPSVPTSGGSGGVLSTITFDTDTNILTLDVGWGSGNGFTDLTGDASMMHLHAEATFTQSAGVIVGLNVLPGFTASASNGGFNGSVILDADDAQSLVNELVYINVHTPDNGGGEIRGNIVAVPEPSSLLLLGASCIGLCVRRRR